jgi:hypothetical protein
MNIQKLRKKYSEIPTMVHHYIPFSHEKLRDFRSDERGIFMVAVVGVIAMILVPIVWLVCISVSQNFVTTFSAQADPIAIGLGNQSLLIGDAVVVVLEVGLIVWIITSAFKRETQESPQQEFF